VSGSGGPSLARRAAILAAMGAVLGSLLDRAHLATGAIAYDTPVTPLGVPLWTTLVYTGAALAIGLSHPWTDRVLRRPQRVLLRAPQLLGGFAALCVLWVASGLLPGSNAAIALVLAAGTGAVLWTLDRTWQGVVLAVETALGGWITEAILVRLGMFHHAQPDVMGLPVWLPFLYATASVAVGNIGRWLAGYTGAEVPEPV
jgi:hypothetical protein